MIDTSDLGGEWMMMRNEVSSKYCIYYQDSTGVISKKWMNEDSAAF